MKKFVLLFGVLGILSSCSNDDDFTDVGEFDAAEEKIVKMEISHSVPDNVVKFVDIDIFSALNDDLSVSGADWYEVVSEYEDELTVRDYFNENQYSVYETDQTVRTFFTTISIDNQNSESIETVVKFYANGELLRTEIIVTGANDSTSSFYHAPIHFWVDGI